MKRSKSSKRALASIVLSFESFVIFFATLAAFGLKSADPASNLPEISVIWAIGLSFGNCCNPYPCRPQEPCWLYRWLGDSGRTPSEWFLALGHVPNWSDSGWALGLGIDCGWHNRQGQRELQQDDGRTRCRL